MPMWQYIMCPCGIGQLAFVAVNSFNNYLSSSDTFPCKKIDCVPGCKWLVCLCDSEQVDSPPVYQIRGSSV